MPSQTEQTGDEFRTEQSSPEFRTVPAEQIGAAWPSIHPLIERALRHGQGDGTTAEHVRAKLLLGDSRLWVAQLEDGRILGGVIWAARRYDTGVKIHVDFIFGTDLSEWLSDLMMLGRHVQIETGAMCIEGSCRPGLAKILKRYGWREKAVIMEM